MRGDWAEGWPRQHGAGGEEEGLAFVTAVPGDEPVSLSKPVVGAFEVVDERDNRQAVHAMRAALTKAFGLEGRKVRPWRLAWSAVLIVAHIVPGFIRAWLWLYAWVFKGDGAPLLAAAKADPDGAERWKKLRDEQRRTREERKEALRVGAMPVLVLVIGAWLIAPRFVMALGAVGALALGYYGYTWRHEPKQLIATAPKTDGVHVPAVTYDFLVEAFGNLGISGIDRSIRTVTAAGRPAAEAIKWDGPIARDARDKGTVIRCELPGAVTAKAIIDKREEFSGALGRSMGCVHLAGDPRRSTSWLEVYIPDVDMAYEERGPGPLLAVDLVTDYFKPFPWGRDPKAAVVTLELEEKNVMIGGEPGGGKTGGLAGALFGSAKDATIEHWVAELKGTGDLEDSKLFASRYMHGAGREPLEFAFELLRALKQLGEERSANFNDVPRDLRPDFKVTRQIADLYPDDFSPLVVVIDEVQRLFMDEKLGKLAGQYAFEATCLSRYSATSLVLALQKPEKNCLPTNLGANMHVRIGFKSADEYTNKQIMGGNATARGVRTHMLEEGQPGMCWVIGGASHRTPVQAMADYYSGRDRRNIAEQAQKLRLARGLLRGQAAGEELRKPDLPAQDFLMDVVQVTNGHPRPKIWTVNLLAALADPVTGWPERYGDWTESTLANAFRPYGVEGMGAHDKPRGDEESPGTTKRGYLLPQVREALRKRGPM